MDIRYAMAFESKYLSLRELAAVQSPGHERVTGPLRAATVYAWDHRIVRVVMEAGIHLPRDVAFTRDLVLSELTGPCWWWLEPDAKPYQGEIRSRWIGVLFFPHADFGVVMWALAGSANQVERMIGTWIVPFETPIEHLDRWQHAAFPSGKAEDVHGAESLSLFVVAGLAFLRQRILTTSLEAPERHARRRAERLDARADVHDVEVVQLRRKAYQRQLPPVGHEQALVQWTCQWIVSGHWRQQFYQRSATHRPIWIMPFLKGPEYKLLRVPSPRIFAVTR